MLTHPTGNRNVRAILDSMDEDDLLAKFITTLAIKKNAQWIKFLPEKLQYEALRRSYDISDTKIVTNNLLEIVRTVFPKIGLERYINKEDSFASIYSVYKAVDKASAKLLPDLTKTTNIGAVYAYEDGALLVFEQAKKMGLKCIYDLPIAYWETSKKLMTEEAERLPEWAKTLGGGISDSDEKLERKTLELQLADMVVGPGSFVMNSIPQWAQNKKLIMAPFGSPKIDLSNNRSIKQKGPIKVLFAGSMGQRKGLGDLFEAVRLLNSKDIELVIMGSLQTDMSFYRGILQNFTYEPGRSHQQVLSLMRTCDIFCLPSIVEGRALVMQEAMSQGLPIIITPNTGGEDLVIEGETGFLVPIRSPEAIAEKLLWFINNRSKIPIMGEKAKRYAATYTWENYGKTVIESIKMYLDIKT